MQIKVLRLTVASMAMVLSSFACAGEPGEIDAPVAPPAAAVDEPLISKFSLESAAHSLDTIALNWQRTNQCAACHTLPPYLMARPYLNSFSPEPPDVRQFFERTVEERREGEGLISATDAARFIEELTDAQRSDGGWSMASLTENPSDPDRQAEEGGKLRAAEGHGHDFLVYVGRDKAYKSSLLSDGYATGLTVYVLRQVGIPSDDDRIRRGIAWIKEHQRASGRWFTPSQSWSTQHYISNAGTAYCVLALQACGEIK